MQAQTFDQRSGQRLKDATKAFSLCERAFVYGTLKEGYGNNRLLLTSELLGATETEGKFVLGNVGFPYAFPPDAVPEQYEKLLFPVKGEMYKVDNVKTFVNLDILEGYPSHYQRRIISFENGLDAWMYVQPDWYNARYCDACTLSDEGVWSWP
jgi:gamma-glutamylcyclotransferase (GGCT)/AIG2-like uncharacterized protein YtfP|tara:strand:+ start:157 stop:615 length:459 start_codon:yes stop_codon:yes gene_type:complete